MQIISIDLIFCWYEKVGTYQAFGEIMALAMLFMLCLICALGCGLCVHSATHHKKTILQLQMCWANFGWYHMWYMTWNFCQKFRQNANCFRVFHNWWVEDAIKLKTQHFNLFIAWLFILNFLDFSLANFNQFNFGTSKFQIASRDNYADLFECNTHKMT